VVWGMPGAVVHAGLSDEILHLHNIGDAILKQVAAR
jgi:chemotaxis response regulator CheB